jgi:hypothetical protein
MWPRFAELVIAAWLAASPWVFGHVDGPSLLRASDWICAAAIAACAAASFTQRARRAHLAELLVAAWLLGFGYLASSAALPALQNNILVAMVLIMFAIVPNEANRPPRAWREFMAARGEAKS